jgi:sporulation protein YlmC with PRC-barrel domain
MTPCSAQKNLAYDNISQLPDMPIYADSQSLTGSVRCCILRLIADDPHANGDSKLSTIAVTVLLIATPACLAQQVVGSITRELRDVTTGRSAKRQVLGKKVFNDNGETVGNIDDIIVAPDKAVSYAIIGAGGFLGVCRHDVAIPVSQLKEDGRRFILAGASKGAIKAMPEFEYAPNQ